MVDFHSHILYGVDDGSESKEMSMAMIKQSIIEGVTHLAMTPHHVVGGFTKAMDDKENYLLKFKELEKEFEGRIKLIPSLEIMFYDEILEDLEDHKIMGYNAKKTVLIEYSLVDYPIASEAVFYNLKKKGYQVILAHPERNSAIRDDVDILYHLHDLGVLFQLNAGSLKGHFGGAVKSFAERLIEVNLIHAVGSDGHKPDRRNMEIRYAYDRIFELNPPLYDCIMQNGKKLILGEEVQVLPPKPWIKNTKKSLLRLFKK